MQATPEMKAAIGESKRWFEAGYLGGKDYFSLNFDQSISLVHDKKSPFFFAPSIGFQWATNYFKGNEADATVAFRAKGADPATGLQMRYTLEQKSGKWVVKDKPEGGVNPHGTPGSAPAGAAEGALPPGHPTTAPPQ